MKRKQNDVKNMRIPVSGALQNSATIIQAAAQLGRTGRLAVSTNNLVYLDVEDDYIHRLFPLLQGQQIKMPNYFGVGAVGAHITTIYPEEAKKIKQVDLGVEHTFSIKSVNFAEIGSKIYYALFVESNSLLQLRKKYNLPDHLCFKGYAIGFHITIGVKEKHGGQVLS